MTIFAFSSLSNGQHLAFNPLADGIDFDLAGATPGTVRVLRSGANLAFIFGGKTVFLDGVTLAQLNADLFSFAGGGALLPGDGTADPFLDYYGADYSALPGEVAGDLQVWGLGGADFVVTGAGRDVLVGNDALSPVTHVSRLGTTGSPTSSSVATISADGRFVAFEGGWTGFGSENNNALDVIVKDMVTGAIGNEHRTLSGGFPGSGSGDPVISADGLVLAFVSSSLLLSPAVTPSNTVFVASTTSLAVEAVSTTQGGTFGDVGGAYPDLSVDGRYVVFESRSTNLAPGGNVTFEDIYLKDRGTGTIERLSTSLTDGDGNGESRYARISADGRYVVFQSAASNLTAGDNNGRIDIFLWDRNSGGLTNITKGFTGNFDSLRPDVAHDSGYGNIVVFDTGASLVAADTNNANDVYAYDIQTGAFSLVSATAAGQVSSIGAQEGAVSGDGRFVVFRSGSANLVAGDTNGYADIFVKDLFTGAIALVSRTAGGQANQSAGASPEISLGGDWIVFTSSASNLAATDGNAGFPDIFRVSNPLLRDTLQGGAGNDTYIIARNDVIIEQANAGIDRVESAISYVLGANLETLVLTGAAAISGTGNTLNNTMLGNGAANRLSGLGGNDAISGGNGNDTLDGGIGNDRLTGGAGNDSLVGGTGNDTLDGGAGNDTGAGGDGDDLYIVDASTDIVSETGTIGTRGDTVQSAVAWTLGATLEHLVLTGTGNIAGAGNAQGNIITGNAGANVLSGLTGNDTLSGGEGADLLNGAAGFDRLTGGGGADAFLLNSKVGADLVTDFVSGTDRLRVSMSGIGAGDGDTVVEGGLLRAAPGGFAPTAELVIFTSNTGTLDAAGAAARIGSASAAYAVGAKAVFAIDNGVSSAVFQFVAADANAAVSAAELTLLATLQGTAATALADYLFVV